MKILIFLISRSERHVELMADNFSINNQKFRLLAKYLTHLLVETEGIGYIYESSK